MFVHAAAFRFGVARCGSGTVGGEDGRFAEGGIDDFSGIVDGRFGAGAVEAFAGEAGGVNVGIGGDDDDIGAGDVLRREYVRSADAALGFDFDFVPQGARADFQGFLRHVGVGDAGRAGGDADDVFAARRSGSGGCGIGSDGGEGFADVVGIGGFGKPRRDVFVADDGTEAFQHAEVFVIAGSDADDEVGGFVVFPIDAVRYLQHGDGGFLDEVTALRCAVRDGDAVAEIGVFLGFSREHAVHIGGLDFAVFSKQGRDLADGVRFVPGGGAETDEGVGELHGYSCGGGGGRHA